MPNATLVLGPVEKRVNGTFVRLEQGDLTALGVDAFVFYAREDLALGSGFGSAIQVRGGEAVKKELKALGSLRMGEAVITSAGNMQAKHIIHACGPKFQEPDTERKLRDCTTAALASADRQGLMTIAFPPLGAGFYGVPLDLCARVMLEALKSHLAGPTQLKEVIICVIDQREYLVFKDKVAAL